MTQHLQHPFQEGEHGLMAWFSKYQSCQQFFVNHAQHTKPVQAVASLINILLPFEKTAGSATVPASSDSSPSAESTGTCLTLAPYIRRLVVTGFDNSATLHGFFGDDWIQGIGAIHEAERRNYLFAAKSEPWLRVKVQYDMENGQTVPFLRPLSDVTEKEIMSAESKWSDWLAMQDWMLGPRAPPGDN